MQTPGWGIPAGCFAWAYVQLVRHVFEVKQTVGGEESMRARVAIIVSSSTGTAWRLLSRRVPNDEDNLLQFDR